MIYQVEEANEHSSDDVSFKFKPLTRSIVDTETELVSHMPVDYDKEEDSVNSDRTESTKKETESEATLEDDLLEEDVEPLIELYSSYA